MIRSKRLLKEQKPLFQLFSVNEVNRKLLHFYIF